MEMLKLLAAASELMEELSQKSGRQVIFRVVVEVENIENPGTIEVEYMNGDSEMYGYSSFRGRFVPMEFN